MKHLLNGVAIAAALVIAAPVWAQAQTPSSASPYGKSGQPATTSPSEPAAAAPAPAAPTAPMAPMASTHRHHRTPHHGTPYGKAGQPKHVARNSEADRLNGEELARLQGGAPPPMPPASSESLYGKSGQPK